MHQRAIKRQQQGGFKITITFMIIALLKVFFIDYIIFYIIIYVNINNLNGLKNPFYAVYYVP